MALQNSPQLDKPTRPYARVSLAAAVDDEKRGLSVEALYHTLEAAEALLGEVEGMCEPGGNAAEHAESLRHHINDALQYMADVRTYYDQEQDERAVA